MVVPGEKIRCHPSIIVERSLSGVVLLAFLVTRFEGTPVAAVLLAAIVALLLFYYRQWKLTTIRFNEAEIVVERDTLFKMKKTLPYTKIASVNVNRGIINRLFGTSRLQININSGSSATVPEAVLTFRRDLADELRSTISEHLYGQEIAPDEDKAVEPLVSFSPVDVIIHGLFSVSTYQTFVGSLFLAYSVFELYTSMGTGFGADGKALISLLIFVAVQVGPSISLILRYYNYRVYRRGETIYLEHGLLRTYKTSFEVSRVNAIRVKQTLIARLMHRSCIEAEVVGLASGSGESLRPILCLLKDDATQQRLLEELVPEFVDGHARERQPEEAKGVLLVRAAIASLVLVLAAAYPSVYVYRETAAIPGIAGTVLPFALPLATAAAALAICYATYVSYRVTEFGTGADLFSFVNGAVDRETVVMNYDKVQMVRITQGPVARLFGVARGRVYLLSAVGGASVSSGYFAGSRLAAIGETVMERIASGEYDWRKNSV
ncbi:PH domain-containing protein [Methanoculleus thermophilus]|jgi:putative membrane protein|uniref:Putative membrane protein n=3 Tax=Methanoculleus thermophilus TaxID=2200 RepID=A0A1G9CEC9_9EURY|nr:PH domain-containing protein [Methanoculleus thermophilus]SDK49997.1 putative membrane protein [Methanoculleus thermophilus]HQD26163.1 PH domain-containing protein [Methanoculleus thermophilus]